MLDKRAMSDWALVAVEEAIERAEARHARAKGKAKAEATGRDPPDPAVRWSRLDRPPPLRERPLPTGAVAPRALLAQQLLDPAQRPTQRLRIRTGPARSERHCELIRYRVRYPR